jgi:hypothetical protein
MREVKRDINPYLSYYKVYTIDELKTENIDPFDPSNWIGYKKKVDENDNLPPGVND